MRYDGTTRQGHRIVYEAPMGARVDVAYWDLGEGADARTLSAALLAAACPWPPDFVISYPLDGSRLSWEHWTAEGALHPNSADGLRYESQTLHLVQYRTADWTGAGEAKGVTFDPGPDTPTNLVSRIIGVYDLPRKVRISDVFGAAFKEFAAGPQYPALYERYMGRPWPAPDSAACPDWQAVDAAGGLQAAIGDRDCIRIAVFPSSPYFFMDPLNRPTGFEYEIGNALVDILAKHYGRPGLRADWVLVTLDLPDDGTANDVLFAELEKRVNRGDYDLAFSAILTLDRESRVAFACHTELFHIDAVYTGRGGLGTPPTGDVDQAAEFLARKSRETGATIEIVHTAAKDQTRAARLLVAKIQDHGGMGSESPVPQSEIADIVMHQKSHVYVGDMIQIQRMARGSSPAVDLDINLYTDEQGVTQPLFLAPFGRKDF